MNDTCKRLQYLAKSRGCYAVTIQVRVDGRVDVIGLDAEGMTRFGVRGDLLLGSSDPTPEQALARLEFGEAMKPEAGH